MGGDQEHLPEAVVVNKKVSGIMSGYLKGTRLEISHSILFYLQK
jgi:hypothetical protein